MSTKDRLRITASFTLALLLGTVTPVHAVRHTCPKSPYAVNLAVVYGNGMFRTHAQADKDLEYMRPMIAKRLGHDPFAIVFDLAYNQNEQWLQQLWQVAKQREVMTVSHYLRILSHAAEAPDWLGEELGAIAAEVDLTAFIDDANLDAHVQTYRDHLRKGRKVVLLAHSQGNLYANAAYRRLFETSLKTPGQGSFGVVGVASPAAEVAGWRPKLCEPLGCYTTFREDAVITVARALAPDTLDANLSGLSGDPWSTDPLWHGLRDAYLRGDASRERILSHVKAFVDEFEDLDLSLHDAAVTVSLDWDTDADLDLHVYENDGLQHVYYAYPRGAAGYLEADDSDGYGPEHYRATCGELMPGGYRFAVGYFAGDEPTHVRLRVQAGALTRTWRRTLPAAQGRASHTDPVTLGHLEVAAKEKNVYDLLLFAQD